MPDPVLPTPPSPLFADRTPERSFPVAAAGIAGVALVILAAVLLLLGRRHGAAGEDPAYASSLQLSDVRMSQSESLSGGKSTYLDGLLSNRGPLTVYGATVRVTFPTDPGAAPQTMTVPVQLIRSREPYVDVVPVRSAPLRPGGSADVRLIVEGVTGAWNQQQPALEVIGVATR